MTKCKCYGDACMFIHKCQQTKRVDQWLELCDLIKDDLQEKFIDLIKTSADQKKQIDLKIKIIYETFEAYCRAVNHIYINDIFNDLNQLFPYIYIEKHKAKTPIEEYENLQRAIRINLLTENAICILFKDYRCVPEPCPEVE